MQASVAVLISCLRVTHLINTSSTALTDSLATMQDSPTTTWQEQTFELPCECEQVGVVNIVITSGGRQ